ncbi:ABC transporter permease [Tengunoibacter tsumagoiensis]|uniref:ABC-2 type transporter transmembrane domain-containing protein n=1 Tax=Tengunoibacter tsumagoiensis TaxID=2014871 RepID=A0A402A2N2_9CHLR|nr:ABC transporter permease [Tengunoibacter tsumagoiensis]GCE13403.1 hypothetical protein KTT_32620 [Tengunoibacter tsumagoiensis]
MTFFALLTKELRLRLRRERTIWVMIVYILLMGLIGWLTLLSSQSNPSTYNTGNTYNSVGYVLYTILIFLQLLLVLFVTPAFTANTINGEKERQTFDLLLCSRLKSRDLVIGKLLAGLTNTFILVAASIPVFSLVFFFGGVAPVQIFYAFLVIVVSALLSGTLGLLCSIIFPRPALSTAIVYMLTLFWLLAPALLAVLFRLASNGSSSSIWLIWNPAFALTSTYNSIPSYSFGQFSMVPWLFYSLISLLITGIFLALSIFFVKPNGHLRIRTGSVRKSETPATTIA